MEKLTIKQLFTLPYECVISITAKVKSRSKEMATHSGLPYQILSVGYETGAIMVLLWGEEYINMLDEGKSYKFKNMKIKEDKKFGGITLGTTKRDDTEIISSADLGEVVEGELPGVMETMVGSILLVNKQMIDYISCKKCLKKIEGDTSQLLVFCKTCDGEILAAKCKSSRVVKIEFEEDTTEKIHHFSVFSNILDKDLDIKSAPMSQPGLRLHLLNLPRMEIIHARKIIQSLKLLE